MRTRIGLSLVGAALICALAAQAQGPQGTVAQVFFVKPKAGARQQFEEAGKRHMDWHRKQKDTWVWPVWEVVAGDRMGMFIAATVDHQWKDFDERGALMQADIADYETNMAPHVESAVVRYYMLMSELSRPPDEERYSPFTEVLEFHLKPDAVEEFLRVNRRIHEAIQKTNWPERYLWYMLWTGGDHPTFVLLLPRQNWSQFAGPDLPFPAMLEKAFGREEGAAVLRALNKTIRAVRSEVMMLRPDLSYMPAGQ
jgi:hypothetical protein